VGLKWFLARPAGGGLLAGQPPEILVVADWLSSPMQEVVGVDRYDTAADLLCFAVHRLPFGVSAHKLAYGSPKVGPLN